MSMISAQIDELRELAGDGSMEWVTGPIRASVLRDAADTIWQLRDDLQRANAENAKLRELAADMGMCLTWQWEPHGYMMDGCDHCRFKGKTGGMCGLGMFRGRMRELGVEVG